MTERMRAVVKTGSGPGFELQEIPVPEISDYEILVNVKAASICGTDLHIYHFDPWAEDRIKLPLVVGHEFSGEVAKIGKHVTRVKEGDTISAESHVICGKCDMCRTGKGHLCRNTQILGIDRDGGFADYIAIPEGNAWIDPHDMSYEIAALQENFGNAVHTAFTVDLGSKTVLVTGCGPVGVMTIAVAKAIGARAVYATDISPYRLDLAMKMGADRVFNAAEINVVEAINALVPDGIDVLLEMSGAPSALNDGFTLLKPGGEAALLGLPGRPLEFDFDDLLIFKGIKVYGVIGRKIWETWFQAQGLLYDGVVNLQPVITHKFPLEEFESAFQLMISGDCGKVVLEP